MAQHGERKAVSFSSVTARSRRHSLARTCPSRTATPLGRSGGVPAEWADACCFIGLPGCETEWHVRMHGAFEINHAVLGIKLTDQSCEARIHLSHVNARLVDRAARDGQSQRSIIGKKEQNAQPHAESRGPSTQENHVAIHSRRRTRPPRCSNGSMGAAICFAAHVRAFVVLFLVVSVMCATHTHACHMSSKAIGLPRLKMSFRTKKSSPPSSHARTLIGSLMEGGTSLEWFGAATLFATHIHAEKVLAFRFLRASAFDAHQQGPKRITTFKHKWIGVDCEQDIWEATRRHRETNS